MAILPARLADVSAECFVLSAAVYSEEWLLDVLQKVTIDDFSRNETRALFTVIASMYEKNERVSIETITLHSKELTDAGYVAGRDLTLTQIIGNPPMAHDLAGYISTIKEMSARRQAYRAAQTMAHMIEQGEMSEAVFDVMEKAVMERTSTGMKRELLSPSDMADAIEETVLERMNPESRKKAVIYSTFGMLNKFSGGFERGDLVILSAESGAGKSALAMNLASGISCTMKRPSLYLNSEMQTKQIALRWASYLSHVSHSALRNGSATSKESAAAVATGQIVRNGALWTLNMPDMQIASVLAEVRRAKVQHNIEIAFVDYIGRMDTMSLKDGKDWQIMKSAAQRLKTLAVELQITVVMIAQLTSDGGRLAQSSYMSHEADLWLNIGKIPEEELQKYYPWNYVLTFRKARNVESGQKVMLRFQGDILTFTDKESEAQKMAGERPPFAGVTIENVKGCDIPA